MYNTDSKHKDLFLKHLNVVYIVFPLHARVSNPELFAWILLFLTARLHVQFFMEAQRVWPCSLDWKCEYIQKKRCQLALPEDQRIHQERILTLLAKQANSEVWARIHTVMNATVDRSRSKWMSGLGNPHLSSLMSTRPELLPPCVSNGMHTGFYVQLQATCNRKSPECLPRPHFHECIVKSLMGF